MPIIVIIFDIYTEKCNYTSNTFHITLQCNMRIFLDNIYINFMFRNI